MIKKKGSTEVKTIEKIQFNKESIAKLKDELLLLRKYLNYKNSNFLKKFLESIIRKYFK